MYKYFSEFFQLLEMRKMNNEKKYKNLGRIVFGLLPSYIVRKKKF